MNGEALRAQHRQRQADHDRRSDALMARILAAMKREQTATPADREAIGVEIAAITAEQEQLIADVDDLAVEIAFATRKEPIHG